MATRKDFTKATRRELEEMMRLRHNAGGALTVLGIVGLFAMVYLFVPAEQRGAEPQTAERSVAR